MKRRSFMQYLTGFAALLGVPSAGAAAQGFGGKMPTAAICAATTGVESLKSRGRIEGTHIIKVVGVGGAGRRAVNSMTSEKWEGVEFVCLDTDPQALARSTADSTQWISDELCAEDYQVDDETRDERMKLADVLRGAHMVVIIAGVGGGTGTFASRNVAAVARELGILTIALVTKPTKSEGQRVALAERGLNELVKSVDALIVEDNESLLYVLEDWGDPVSMGDLFEESDNALRRRLGSIVEIVNGSRLCRVDFADVHAVFHASGKTVVGACGPTVTCFDNDNTPRLSSAKSSAESAMYCVTDEGCQPTNSPGILVSIQGDESLNIVEVDEVMKHIRAHSPPGAKLVFGVSPKPIMQDFFRVTVFATGFRAHDGAA